MLHVAEGQWVKHAHVALSDFLLDMSCEFASMERI